MLVCVCACVCDVPALLAFHTAELRTPTSRQRGNMADMQLSGKKVEKNTISLKVLFTNKTKKKWTEFQSQLFSELLLCVLQRSSEEEYGRTSPSPWFNTRFLLKWLKETLLACDLIEHVSQRTFTAAGALTSASFTEKRIRRHQKRFQEKPGWNTSHHTFSVL